MTPKNGSDSTWAAELARRSRVEQGFSASVEDPALLAAVVRLLGPPGWPDTAPDADGPDA